MRIERWAFGFRQTNVFNQAAVESEKLNHVNISVRSNNDLFLGIGAQGTVGDQIRQHFAALRHGESPIGFAPDGLIVFRVVNRKGPLGSVCQDPGI